MTFERWNVTPQAGNRIRFTDRSCANLMQTLIALNGKLIGSKVEGHKHIPDRAKFFRATIELPAGTKEEFEFMSGFKLKHSELIG